MVTRFSLDPTPKLSEMTKHLRRDDDNPRRTSEEANHQRLYRISQILPYVNYIKFLQYKSILTVFPVKLLCNDCIVKKTNNLELN